MGSKRERGEGVSSLLTTNSTMNSNRMDGWKLFFRVNMKHMKLLFANFLANHRRDDWNGMFLWSIVEQDPKGGRDTIFRMFLRVSLLVVKTFYP